MRVYFSDYNISHIKMEMYTVIKFTPSKVMANLIGLANTLKNMKKKQAVSFSDEVNDVT